MTVYPLDIDAGQVVHWLLDAERRHEERLSVRSTRQYLAQAVAPSEKGRLGDQEAEELSEVTAVGVLEVEPPPDRDGWLLRIRIGDELGPRLPEDESATSEEEAIDLEAFEADFIRPDTGTMEVTAELVSPAGKRRLDRFLAKIREDRHTRRRQPRA